MGPTFSISGEIRNFSVGLETILAGHQDWVYSAHWHPSNKSFFGHHFLLKAIFVVSGTRLLTASMDKCLIVWEPDESSGLWIEKVPLLIYVINTIIVCFRLVSGLLEVQWRQDFMVECSVQMGNQYSVTRFKEVSIFGMTIK